jgi:hypothetical protein
LNSHTSLVLPLGPRLIFGWYEAGIYQCWACMSTFNIPVALQGIKVFSIQTSGKNMSIQMFFQ